MIFRPLATATLLSSLMLTACSSDSNIDIGKPSQKVSYMMGYSIAQSLYDQGLNDLDPELISLGIREGLNKKDSRVSTEDFKELVVNFEKERNDHLNEIHAKEKDFLKENRKKDSVITTKSGLQYEIIKKNDGARPQSTDRVTVHYHGTFIDGKVFDSSIKNGGPVTFPVNGVIPGWTEALQLMHVGEKYRLYIPSDLGYGNQRQQIIPENSLLIFDLELVSINK